MSHNKHPRIFISPPHLSGHELVEIREALESNYVAPCGPKVKAFEEEMSKLLNGLYTLAVNSGTSAMHLTMKALNISPGDRLLSSTMTFIGGVSPACWLGAEIAFIDVDHSSWNMDPELLAEELKENAGNGRLPKLVLSTDLYGQCAGYDRLEEICKEYDVPLVIDSAQAMGSTYKGRPAGVAGIAGIFSFNGNKILTTSSGGMLISSHEEIIEKSRYLSQQAKEPVAHYVHNQIGFNYGMSNILAAIGLGQLRVLNQRVVRKRSIFRFYKQALGDISGIEFMPEASYGQTNRWLTVMLVDPDGFGMDREAVRLAMEDHNIETRPIMTPMHIQPVFQKCRVRGGSVSERFFKYGLCLPSGTGLTTADLERIVDIIKALHKNGLDRRICQNLEPPALSRKFG